MGKPACRQAGKNARLFFYLLQTLLLLKQVACFMPEFQSCCSDSNPNLPNLLAGFG
jgi:hypothetical protein